MKLITSCPSCKSESLEKIMSVHDYLLTGEIFQITGCQKCSLRFTNPKPLENEIHKYYESSEYISHSDSAKGIVNFLYRLIRKFTIARKSGIIKTFVKEGKLLDIGCGTGEFLHRMQQGKFDVFGIEPGETARSSAKIKYNLNVFDDDALVEIQKESFDIVTLWHVFEHVYSLEEKILQIKTLIKPGGFLFIAVPNFDSYDANHYGKHWAAYDVPRHLFHFNLKSLPEFILNFGFLLVKTKPQIFDSFYISLLSEKIKTGKSNYFRGFCLGLRSNLSAITTKNYSSNLFIFKKNNN